MDFGPELQAARALAEQQRVALARFKLRDTGGFDACHSPLPYVPIAGSEASDVAPQGDPCWWGVGEIASAYRTGIITPLALVDALIARIDRFDPHLHSFIHLDRAGARAAAADPNLPRGPLYGVPVGIKDVIDVAGLATTCHSATRLNHIAHRDAAVVAQLRAAGAIIMGKLATHEYAIGGPAFDLPFPPARNPWNTAHHPGGSSSGAGAAVAAGLVPIAIGTDTAGSVRNPASACGIVGLKAGLGVLPLAGVVPLAPTLDHVGLLARSVADMAPAAAALSVPMTPSPIGRVGYVRHFHTHDMIATPEVAAALDSAAAALGAVEVTLPPLGDFALINRIILQAEGYAAHGGHLRKRPEALSHLTRAALLPGEFIDADMLALAMQGRTMLTAAVDAALLKIDILITASSMENPCRIDDKAEIARTYMLQARSPFNVTGHPALAMGAGISTDGLPLSVQFVSRMGEEGRLLAAAAVWEGVRGDLGKPMG